MKKIAVLKEIARRFNEAGVVWALGASMLLYFKGIVPDFDDIDLMVSNEDANAARGILLEMGELQPPNPNAKYKTSVFLEFVIDGVDVDAMAGFAIVSGDATVDCALKREQIAEIIDLDGVQVPAQSVSLWRTYYKLMGRTDKVEMIRNALSKTGKTGV